MNEQFKNTTSIIERHGLRTVCQGAECPNRWTCYGEGIATFLILGGICTRNCRFCAVDKGKPTDLDLKEPDRVVEVIGQLGLDYAVITSVTRDDLPDGGAGVFAEIIRLVHQKSPKTLIEVLTPDFRGDVESLRKVAAARPDVFNHNLETIHRLYPFVRPQAVYEQSLRILAEMKQMAPKVITKSGIMVGLGEKPEEVREVFADLRQVNCDLLTIGQYLSPSKHHLPVTEFITPDQFIEYEKIAYSLGFSGVVSGPFVRSSYHAKEIFKNIYQ